MTSAQSLLPSAPLEALVRTLLPDRSKLRLEQASIEPNQLVLTVATTQTQALCPLCSQAATRIQSRYTRTLADLPWASQSVSLRLLIRRFFCFNHSCARKVFTERLPSVVLPYARRTNRLREHLLETAFALGGEAGARQCASSGIGVSADTLLALLRRQALPAQPTPRVLGVDDWSFRRGHEMATILVDLERHHPVDLLPDRSEDSFAAWLESHPGVEVISRDRGEIYAVGGRRGAPGAIHVADRWHLLKNLGDAVVKLMSRHAPTLRHAAAQIPREPFGAAELPQPAALVVKPQRKRSTPAPLSVQRQRQLEMYQEVRALVRQNWTVAAIAEHLHLNRITVRKYRDMDSFRDQRTTSRVSEAEPYRAYLEQRWAEGCSEAKQLWLELQTQGYEGGYKSVWQFTRYWKLPETLAPAKPAPVPTTPTRTPRQAMWLVMRRVDELSQEDSVYREHMVEHCPELAVAERLVKEFQVLLRHRQAEKFDDWLERATTSGVGELRRFALGLLQDEAAVRAALSQEWSNGQVEGQVTKLKLVKRQMYGRAKFDLLRARVLHRAKP
jgi:transposase